MTKASARSRELFDRDKMNQASRKEVGDSMVSVFDRIQLWSKEKQLLALASAFILLADVSGIPAQDVFTASKNLMYDPLTRTGLAPQFQAMQFHLKTDILTKEPPAGVTPRMDSLADLPGKLASALIAIALILLALKGPPSTGAGALAKNQMSFPFMVSQLGAKQRGHPFLRNAAARYIRLATGEKV